MIRIEQIGIADNLRLALIVEIVDLWIPGHLIEAPVGDRLNAEVDVVAGLDGERLDAGWLLGAIVVRRDRGRPQLGRVLLNCNAHAVGGLV